MTPSIDIPNDTKATSPGQPHDEAEELGMYLERDQLVLDKAQPVPRAKLSSWATAGLWALRVFVILVSAMVVYTFAAQVLG